MLHQVSTQAVDQRRTQPFGVLETFGFRRQKRQIAGREIARRHSVDEPLQQIRAARVLHAQRQMQRRLVHRDGDVIAASRNVQKVSRLQHLIQFGAGRRDRAVFQPAAVDALDAGSVQKPALAPVQLENEDFLAVSMQIEAVQGAPPCVDIDLGAATEERLERFRQPRQRLVQLVDCVKGQRRAAAQVIGQIFRADARGVTVQVRVRRRIEIASLQRQAETKRLPPVMGERRVERVPGKQWREAVGGAPAEEMALEPVVRKEFLDSHRGEERGEPRLRVRATIHRPGARRYEVKCMFW